MKNSGELIVITGPMFAGKTKMLLEKFQKASRKRRAILFKSGMDNRYSETEVVAHDGTRLPAAILPDGEECIRTLKEARNKYDIIGIDEGQFWQDTKGFSYALHELVFDSKTVYVSMLNKNSDGHPFSTSMELIPLADRVYVLRAECSKCGGKANFTQKVINGVETFGYDISSAGSNRYEARCRRHFVRPGKSN
jgi:thymidine kinase